MLKTDLCLRSCKAGHLSNITMTGCKKKAYHKRPPVTLVEYAGNHSHDVDVAPCVTTAKTWGPTKVVALLHS